MFTIVISLVLQVSMPTFANYKQTQSTTEWQVKGEDMQQRATCWNWSWATAEDSVGLSTQALPGDLSRREKYILTWLMC